MVLFLILNSIGVAVVVGVAVGVGGDRTG